ncbi:MAG: helix-turn-helix transcriptional regulator [Phycisphaerales bacterium]|nr:helix-turn-helix transcriptional regulator [Phycisphaerales bacterium]
MLDSALRWLLREQVYFTADQSHLLPAAMQRFLVELCRQTRRIDRITPASVRQPEWLTQVQTLIDRDYAHPIGLADMVRLSNSTPEHLCRRFKQTTGLSPLAYLTQRRIQAAAWLLRTTSLQVSEIALNCGFNEQSHFNRKFKQAMHQSPTEYRQELRSDDFTMPVR